jgi:hypothetical protein
MASRPICQGASGRGRIPIHALTTHAEAHISGIPDKPMQRGASDAPNDWPIDFQLDFATKTFRIANAPFNADQARGSVTVVGKLVNQPPLARPGANQTVECTAATGTPVTLDGSGSQDPDGNILSNQWYDGPPIFVGGKELTPGATATALVPFTPPRSTSRYSLSVVDTFLVTSLAHVDVTVQDTTPPALMLVTTPDCLWAPAHKMVLFELGTGLKATTTDACDPSPRLAIANVVSSQPPLGGGSGNTSPDVVFGKRAVCLRSERAGTSSEPRAYTVSVKATDVSGNSTVRDTIVRVGHDQAALQCPRVDAARIVADDDPRCAKN